MDLQGTIVGNYVVGRKVGEGGMGTVFLAEHPRIRRRVAIKVLHPQALRIPGVAARFLTEARASSAIVSEHVIEIFDFGELPSGEPYMAMEWLDGSTLADRLREVGRFSLSRMIHVLEGIAHGLSAAHAMGVVHRDLKPENVFLVERNGDRDFVKILDFGIAKITRAGSMRLHATEVGAVLGTPSYMSPEQAKGAADLDFRSDIYSLGVMVYEMVTGQLPFRHDSWSELVLAHLTEVPTAPGVVVPGLPSHVSEAIVRALAKHPQSRFGSVREMVDAISGRESPQRPVAAGATLPLDPTSVIQAEDTRTEVPSVGGAVPIPPRQRQGWRVLAAGLMGLALPGGGLALYSYVGSRSHSEISAPHREVSSLQGASESTPHDASIASTSKLVPPPPPPPLPAPEPVLRGKEPAALVRDRHKDRGCGAPLVPRRPVATTRITLPRTDVSLAMPLGWAGTPTAAADGTPTYVVDAPEAGPNGLVVLASPTVDQGLPLNQVALGIASHITQARTTESRTFGLARGCGVQLILRAPDIEGYVTVFQIGAWTLELASRYPVSKSEAMRSRLDTMVASLRVASPQGD